MLISLVSYRWNKNCQNIILRHFYPVSVLRQWRACADKRSYRLDVSTLLWRQQCFWSSVLLIQNSLSELHTSSVYSLLIISTVKSSSLKSATINYQKSASMRHIRSFLSTRFLLLSKYCDWCLSRQTDPSTWWVGTAVKSYHNLSRDTWLAALPIASFVFESSETRD